MTETEGGGGGWPRAGQGLGGGMPVRPEVAWEETPGAVALRVAAKGVPRAQVDVFASDCFVKARGPALPCPPPPPPPPPPFPPHPLPRYSSEAPSVPSRLFRPSGTRCPAGWRGGLPRACT